MDEKEIISYLVIWARYNRRRARDCRKHLPGSLIAEWHEGKAEAFMFMARYIQEIKD